MLFHKAEAVDLLQFQRIAEFVHSLRLSNKKGLNMTKEEMQGQEETQVSPTH